jgi:hypothetical protein
MKIGHSIIRKLSKLNIEFRALSHNCFLLDEDIQVGHEGKRTIIRICENSLNPLDVYLTTKNNYKVYDKNGNLIFKIDNVYYTEQDFINYLKKY